jgi:hypothetical protein
MRTRRCSPLTRIGFISWLREAPPSHRRIAPLDRHAPPSLLIRGGDEAAFDRAGNVFFRSLGEHANFLHRMKSDGSSNVRVLEAPIVEFHAVAPDARRVSVDLPIEGGIAGAFLAPVGGVGVQQRLAVRFGLRDCGADDVRRESPRSAIIQAARPVRLPGGERGGP